MASRRFLSDDAREFNDNLLPFVTLDGKQTLMKHAGAFAATNNTGKRENIMEKFFSRRFFLYSCRVRQQEKEERERQEEGRFYCSIVEGLRRESLFYCSIVEGLN